MPDHMTDNDVERRIQEELRIRQQNKTILNASRAYPSAGGPPAGPSAVADYMNMIASAEGSNYYAQRYGSAAAAFGMDSLYARQQQQHAHAAAAAAYGYAPRSQHYGYHHGPTASEIYSQQMAAMEQRAAAAAYGQQHQQQHADRKSVV